MLIENEQKMDDDYADNDDNDDNDNDKDNNGKKAVVQMKGAPERILESCDRYMYEDQIHDLTDDVRKEILDGIMQLGARGERVLALAELILPRSKYDVNVVESVIERKYDDEIDNSCGDDPVVIVMYNDKKIKITVAPIDPDSNKSIEFEHCKILHLMEAIEKEIKLPVGSQRISFSDKGDTIEYANSFKELGIQKGSLLHLQKGPYIFSGTKKEEVNWPFNRNDSEIGLIFIGLYAVIH